MFLLHPATPPWAVPDATGLQLVLLSDTPLPAGRVFVRCLPDNEELLTPMQPDGHEGALQRWRAHIAWDGGHGLQRYCFVVALDGAKLGDEGRLHWLGADGLHAELPPEAVHFRHHRFGQPPAWVRDQVFYQVFPDRFARGNPAPFVPPPGAVASPWGARPESRLGQRQFFGGDLAGVTQQNVIVCGRDPGMEICQRFGALRPIGHRIALEIEDAVRIMLLQLLGSLAFPDAKSDFRQTRIKLHRQRQALRNPVGESPAAAQW
jgi:hypothetical protein